MKIAFTICSNNYLAQAKTLGDSILNFNPEYSFIIGLVDRKDSKVDYNFFRPHKIISVEELLIPDFDKIWKKYNIIELNTSVKATYFKHIAETHPEATILFYFDPDIQVFNSFNLLENELASNDILLTPHILSPMDLDEFSPSENLFLNYGLYNLGFLGLNIRSQRAKQMLCWWEERTLKLGFDNVAQGFFLDQLWINLVPIFFSNVEIMKHLGCNAAPWNLHERRNIFFKNDKYFMEDGSELLFYHFSSYKFNTPKLLSHNYSRFQFENCNDAVGQLYMDYHKVVMANCQDIYEQIPCFYVDARNQYLLSKVESSTKFYSLSEGVKKIIREFVPPFFLKVWKSYTNSKSNK